jgi:O-antigen/teichoic acid export membrane protein
MDKYLSNAGWMFIEKVTRLGMNFVFLGLIARQIGPGDFGVLSFSQSIALMLLSITSLGLDNILIKEFSQNEKIKNVILSTALIMQMIAAIFVITISAFVCIYFYGINSDAIVFIISLSSLFFYVQNAYISYYQSKSKSIFITKQSLISITISSLFKLYLLENKASIELFAFSFCIDLMINFILIYLYSQVKKEIIFSACNFDVRMMKDLLIQSWPMIFSSIFIVLYTRLDQFMIMRMLGPEEVGLFSVAVKISDAYTFIPVLVGTSFYPLIAKDCTKEKLKKYIDIVFFCAFGTGMLVIALSTFVIPLLFGEKYTASIHVSNITVFSSMFACLGGAVTNYLITIRLGYIRLYRAIIGVIVNLVLNLIWIPKYGIIGAAYASLAAQIFAAWLSNYLSRKTRECFWLQSRSLFMIGLPSIYSLIFNRNLDDE